MHAEELIARWQVWLDRPTPGSTNALVDAQIAYAGTRHNDLAKHVQASRREGLSLSAAIYTWSPE